MSSLPDVQNSAVNAPVFHLYRLGVLTGSDAYGTFHPYQSITRAETAAILHRVLEPAARKYFTLAEVPSIEAIYDAAFEQAYEYFYYGDDYEMSEDLKSGWFGQGYLGCDFYDIDGNGTLEMLVGFSEWPGSIYAIYTIHDYHAVCLGTGFYSFGSEKYYTLCDDGRIACWYGSPVNGAFELYQFPTNGTKLILTDSFAHTDDGDKYWYSNKTMYNHLDPFNHTGYKSISYGYYDSVTEKFRNSVRYTPYFE